jgi:hypothetical protein
VDADGLTNYEEYTNATRLTNPDTDGDGLTDGLEVYAYHTNPLLWDTDGDTYSDGAEVAAGTDPRDPLSYPQGIPAFSIGWCLLSLLLLPIGLKRKKQGEIIIPVYLNRNFMDSTGKLFFEGGNAHSPVFV